MTEDTFGLDLDDLVDGARARCVRLLSGLISVLQARKKNPLDWFLLSWAGIVFLAMIQFCWAIHEIPGSIHTLGFLIYLLLVALILLLFASASLLLSPEHEGHGRLWAFFEEHGRDGLLTLAAHEGLAPPRRGHAGGPRVGARTGPSASG